MLWWSSSSKATHALLAERESLAWADVDGAHTDGSLSQTIMWAKLDVVNTLRKNCTDWRGWLVCAVDRSNTSGIPFDAVDIDSTPGLDALSVGIEECFAVAAIRVHEVTNLVDHAI
jgi:hypothetical protein